MRIVLVVIATVALTARRTDAANTNSPPAQTSTAKLATNVVAIVDVNFLFDSYYKSGVLATKLRKMAEQYNQEYETLKAKKPKTPEDKKLLSGYVASHQTLLKDETNRMKTEIINDIRAITVWYARKSGYNHIEDKSGSFYPFFWSERDGDGPYKKVPRPSNTRAPDITVPVSEILNKSPTEVIE
jgi:hypothetical protein